MSHEERVRACYQHAALRKVVTGKGMTNASLRKRFSVPDENYSTVSRIIADAIRAGFIKPQHPGLKSRRMASYLPAWA